MRMSDIDVSIIILNYNTKALLLACLASIEKARTLKDRWEVIVVDNASTDGSVKEISNFKSQISNLKIIQNDRNLGFAAGNNVGIKMAKGRYVLLLNSDTEVTKDAIILMLDFMDAHPKVGVSTCKLVLPDGSMDPACHRGFPTPWAAFTYMIGLEKLFPHSHLFAQYHQRYKNLLERHEIDSPSGAFFLVRQEVINNVGMLDEDYFMYGEDLDWAYRIKQAGWQIWFYPKASVLHRKRQSGRANVDAQLRRQTQKYFYQTMELFYKKHYGHRYGWIVTQLVLLGIKLRSLL